MAIAGFDQASVIEFPGDGKEHPPDVARWYTLIVSLRERSFTCGP